MHEILPYVVLIPRSVPNSLSIYLPVHPSSTSNLIVCVGRFLLVCLLAFLFLMQYQVAQDSSA